MKKTLFIVAAASVCIFNMEACTKTTTNPDSFSLYQVLTKDWNISSAKQINNGVVSYPGRSRSSVFCFKADTTISYAGIGEEFRYPTKYTLNSSSQFTFDTTKVYVRIIDSLCISLDMVSIKNPAYKKEITLIRKR